jgi:cyclophilin family peptidyl-prolyl cis-trans isomerase
MKKLIIPVSAVLLLLAGCSSERPAPVEKAAEVPKEAPKEEPKAEPKKEEPEEVVKVRFDTSKGPIMIEVHPKWAPLGAKRFLDLVEDKFFDEARFFRVVPNFVIQFGLAASPAKTKKWDTTIKDDPVIRTNATGTLSFATAGPMTRTSQIFINLRSNQNLDDQGFAPFAKIVDGAEVVDKIYAAYGERPDQELATQRGNAYLKAEFPNLDYIRTGRVVK